ncbi:hypothetical protein WICPIJ_004136 [Wickerhamomyces pijperi]|uniref:Phosphoglycerate mutase n=1 Tax=Wickerhamomyces pijperi TaxID=599730 RepID=A0A9P8Q665_WICPI|nr:hypothetical protein WICPIJ_004136 [Wickerhamomyces pijperi]
MPSIILLRHGQSQFNSSSKFCGWLDVPLSEKGQLQAQQAGQLILSTLPEYTPDLLITSKLRRSAQTGYLLSQVLQREYMDVDRTWRLNERHYGALQGRDKSEVLKEVGEKQYMYIRRDFHGVPPLLHCRADPNSGIDDRYDGEGEVPLGESLEMVIKRLQPYLESVIDRMKQGRRPLIVAHGSTCRSILKILKKISDEDIKDVNIPNAIPILLEFGDASENWEFKGFRYLDEEEAKERAAAVAKEGFHFQDTVQLDVDPCLDIDDSPISRVRRGPTIVVTGSFKEPRRDVNKVAELLVEKSPVVELFTDPSFILGFQLDVTEMSVVVMSGCVGQDRFFLIQTGIELLDGNVMSGSCGRVHVAQITVQNVSNS